VEALPESSRLKFLEFFTAQIRNANTRRCYAKVAVEFLSWCELRGALSLGPIRLREVASQASSGGDACNVSSRA